MSYETQLLRSEAVARGTMAFHFERPAGFTYHAGQNASLTLMDSGDYDSYGPSRTFSFVSAPHEPQLTFATRMRDTAFKRALKSAAPGFRAKLDGPAGIMTLHEDTARAAVWIAGGIGVTPFVSMARHAAHARLPHRIWLFYSNRRPEDAPFLAELRELERANLAYRFVPTMTAMATSSVPWSGDTDRLGKALLERHLQGVRRPIYYVAGPPGMVLSMRSMLDGLGVADADVRDEEFYGYSDDRALAAS